jgi:hypothetical protein
MVRCPTVLTSSTILTNDIRYGGEFHYGQLGMSAGQALFTFDDDIETKLVLKISEF